MHERSDRASASLRSLSRNPVAWALWLLGVIAGGFVVALWLAFGIAAAQGASTTLFVGKALLAVLISQGGCLYAFSRGHLVTGVLLNWAMVPMVFLLDDPAFILVLFR